MKIFVCMKQVPASQQVEIDPETGAMKRQSDNVRTNPYDFYALEAALDIREREETEYQNPSEVTVLTMGPPSAETMMKDAYAMGADHAVILSDRKFAGADVLATSFTLSQGIQAEGGFDLILCGRQTTDGDTAQVGPALAEHLGVPHAAWVREILEVTAKDITVRQDFAGVSQVSRIAFPCLITVEKDMCVPRLPSYRRKTETQDRPVKVLTYQDLPVRDLTRYGLIGSPTAVERMFAPPGARGQEYIEGAGGAQKARTVFGILKKEKLI